MHKKQQKQITGEARRGSKTTAFNKLKMTALCSTLAWRTPCTEEPGGLQFMGLRRVGSDSAAKQQKILKPIKLCLKIENQMHKICKYFISYNYIIKILYRKFLKEPIRNCRSKSIITEIKISVNGFNLLKLQYFGHLM